MDDERALRLGAFQRRRRERLLAVLPRIYAVQPQGSVIYQLLDVMAGRLAEMDEALGQVMASRWARTAAGERLFAELLPPLDLLAGPFELPRLAATAEQEQESTPAYRERLLAITTVLAQGVTTPKALLDLTRAILGNDVQARVIDNPLWEINQKVPNLEHLDPFPVQNGGLLADRPVVCITAPPDRDVAYPAVRNLKRSEVVLYAGVLGAGETLVIRPELEAAERAAFESLEQPDPHAWKKGAASATIGTKDVSKRIYYMAGSQFDKARFAAPNATDGQALARFANPGQRVYTPRVEPGKSMWGFYGYCKSDLVGTAGDFTNPAPPQEPTRSKVTVTLSYWTQAPATFKLEVTTNDAIRREPQRAQLLRQLVERTRGAGIRAQLEFREPAKREDHSQLLGEGVPRLTVTLRHSERAELGEPTLRRSSSLALKERHELSDAPPILGSRFDRAQFDRSRLG